MYFTYIIYSAVLNQYYVGQTSNIEDRLFRHRNSGSKATKKAKDWELKYKKGFETRSEATSWETYIKSRKSREFIEELISSSAG